LERIRVNDLARQIGVKSKRILNAYRSLKTGKELHYASALTRDEAAAITAHLQNEPTGEGVVTATSVSGISSPASSNHEITDLRHKLIERGLITPAKVGREVPRRLASSSFSPAISNLVAGARVPANDPRLVRCSVCGSLCKKTHLSVHMNKVHSRCVSDSKGTISPKARRKPHGKIQSHSTSEKFSASVRFPIRHQHSSKLPRVVMVHQKSESTPDVDQVVQCIACRATVFSYALSKHYENCHADEKASLSDSRVTRLPFELLPAGTLGFREFLENCRSDLRHRDFFAGKIDWDRIEQIASLKPSRTYVGRRVWFGYAVYEFSFSTRVLLDCPIEGNAAYVLEGNWSELIRHNKAQLREELGSRCTKVVHKGNWVGRIKDALRSK